ncbi:MAG: zinc ABC transporter substrate-binding protein [Saprospiraceae bacterium]|nr:zinc ABC transporter substrate-binding protein [Saprospiraceae bacterium]
MKTQLLILLAFLFTSVSSAQNRIKVVTSASIFKDMTENIGGDKVDVYSIVPIGGDPHLYEPKPSDAQLIKSAELILVNGLTFEGWIAKLIDNSNTKAPTVTITEGVDVIKSDTYENAADPHAWMDANNGLVYIKNIKNALIKADPANSAIYLKNYQTYLEKIKALDAYILKSIQKIPREKRILVTSHDAFAYFGKRYGLELNALKGISTEAEIQTSDMVRVKNRIKDSGVPAIFVESTIDPKVIQQIALDNGVKVGGELYADSLGEEDSEGATYITMLTYNTDVIVNALSREVFAKNKGSNTAEDTNFFVYFLLALIMLGGLGLLISRFNGPRVTTDKLNSIAIGETIISVKGVSVSYERKRVLTNIFLKISKGGLYGVVGPNGAGKSTLFKSILGLIETNSGEIEIMNHPIEEVRQKVAYVPQKDDVDWSFPATVFDVVLQGRYPYKGLIQGTNQNDREKAMNALEELGISELANRQIGQLSGGQQQRVFIARALCQEAEIIFLDEPFVGVDNLTEEKIIQILKRLASEGKTLLVVHHDLSTVEQYFDKVILLNQRLIAYGDTDTTFTSENMSKCYGPQLSILHKTGMFE